MFAIASVAVAQSPGSAESELQYAQEYMDAQKWDYAMWRYEAILRMDPDNAAARAGYEKAKAAYEAKKARQEEQARAFDRPKLAPGPKPRPVVNKGPQSKPVSKA